MKGGVAEQHQQTRSSAGGPGSADQVLRKSTGSGAPGGEQGQDNCYILCQGGGVACYEWLVCVFSFPSFPV